MNDNALKLSAALSYYTIFSLAPMLLVIISMVSIFFGKEAIQGELFGQIAGLVGKQAADQIQEIIKNAQVSNQSTTAATIGVITLLIGATGVFAEIQDSINYIWSIKSKPQKSWINYLKNRLLSFSIIIALGFLLIVSLGVNSAVDLLSNRLERYFSEVSVILFSVLNVALVIVIITALFTVIFKVLPDGHVRWKECIVGALFTAVLFAIGKFAISFYLGKANLGATYGTSASIVILLTWVYYSSIILYFGAEFTKTYAKLDGVGIFPNEHAVLMERREVETVQGKSANDYKNEGSAVHNKLTDKIFEPIHKYIDHRISAIKNEVKALIAKAASPVTYYLLLFVVAFLALVTLTVITGQLLNQWLQSDYLGFVILMGFTLVLLSLCVIYRDKVLIFTRKMLTPKTDK